jgi:hypothetical protein
VGAAATDEACVDQRSTGLEEHANSTVAVTGPTRDRAVVGQAAAG